MAWLLQITLLFITPTAWALTDGFALTTTSPLLNSTVTIGTTNAKGVHHLCQGAIAGQWVITDAHCMVGKVSALLYLQSANGRTEMREVRPEDWIVEADFQEHYSQYLTAFDRWVEEVKLDPKRPEPTEPEGLDLAVIRLRTPFLWGQSVSFDYIKSETGVADLPFLLVLGMHQTPQHQQAMDGTRAFAAFFNARPWSRDAMYMAESTDATEKTGVCRGDSGGVVLSWYKKKLVLVGLTARVAGLKKFPNGARCGDSVVFHDLRLNRHRLELLRAELMKRP